MHLVLGMSGLHTMPVLIYLLSWDYRVLGYRMIDKIMVHNDALWQDHAVWQHHVRRHPGCLGGRPLKRVLEAG